MKIGTMARRVYTNKMLERLPLIKIGKRVSDVLIRLMREQYLLVLTDVIPHDKSLELVFLSLMDIGPTASHVLKSLCEIPHLTFGLKFSKDEENTYYTVHINAASNSEMVELIEDILVVLRKVAKLDLNSTIKMLRFTMDKTGGKLDG